MTTTSETTIRIIKKNDMTIILDTRIPPKGRDTDRDRLSENPKLYDLAVVNHVQTTVVDRSATMIQLLVLFLLQLQRRLWIYCPGHGSTVLGTPESVGMNGQIDWQA